MAVTAILNFCLMQWFPTGGNFPLGEILVFQEEILAVLEI